MKLKTQKEFIQKVDTNSQYTEDIDILYADRYNDALEDLKENAIKWIKEIHAESGPIFPNKEVNIPWFGEMMTLSGGDQIFAAKAVLQSIFNIRQKDIDEYQNNSE